MNHDLSRRRLSSLTRQILRVPQPSERLLQCLEEEMASWPGRRLRAEIRKLVCRELLLVATGQTLLRRSKVPAHTQRVLWIYNLTAVGDSLMDLSARARVPTAVALDLLIAPALAPLFEHDSRFSRVYTRATRVHQRPDFLLFEKLNTRAACAKLVHWPMLPFAEVLPPTVGEHFDRVAYSNLVVESLLGLQPAPASRPALALPDGDPPGLRPATGRFTIAVALGARDPRRHYRRWAEVLNEIVLAWPPGCPSPFFRLLGTGNAREDAAQMTSSWLDRHADLLIDKLALSDVGRTVRGSTAFLGCDGGLMHLALAFDRPGLALFIDVDPAMRIPAGSAMRTLRAGRTLDELAAATVVSAFTQAIGPPSPNATDTTHDLHFGTPT